MNERINNFTGKPYNRDVFGDFMQGITCDECEKETIAKDCEFCGAPNCCWNCGCPGLENEATGGPK